MTGKTKDERVVVFLYFDKVKRSLEKNSKTRERKRENATHVVVQPFLDFGVFYMCSGRPHHAGIL